LPNDNVKDVPKAIKVQLTRLFGSDSPEARMENRSDAQWRSTLLKVVHELDRYLAANVETDALHLLMLHSGLYAADLSLKSENFWPAYAEGITRFAILLMGDYPDHHKRKAGRKRENHYRLSRLRSVHYIQDSNQKVNTLVAAHAAGMKLATPPFAALRSFRDQFGYKPGYAQFLKWYRKEHPQDYAAVF
jgi:hypothetical protein